MPAHLSVLTSPRCIDGYTVTGAQGTLRIVREGCITPLRDIDSHIVHKTII